MNIKPASKTTLHDNILAQLVQGIRSGDWLPGDKLPGEQELARSFGVSRNMIREVLKALALAGVLEAHPGQGTFLTMDAVDKLDGGGLASTIWGDASLWDIKEVRSLLEGHIAYLAAKRVTEEDIKTLENALTRVSSEENLTESHARFHRVLSTMSGNPLLANLLHSVQNLMDNMRRRYSTMPRVTLENFDVEHRQIFEMVKNRQPEEARTAVIKHIDDAWTDSLYASLRKKPAKNL